MTPLVGRLKPPIIASNDDFARARAPDDGSELSARHHEVDAFDCFDIAALGRINLGYAEAARQHHLSLGPNEIIGLLTARPPGRVERARDPDQRRQQNTGQRDETDRLCAQPTNGIPMRSR